MLTLESSYEEYLAEMERVRILYRLKHTMRYLSERDMNTHSESVAEHIYAMDVIAQYFYPLEDPEGKLDRARVHELMLFHEIGEIETGDIINHRKTEQHRREEREAAKRVIKKIPANMQRLVLERHLEFEENMTPESRYANAIDKIEPLFEMWDERIALPLFRRFGYTKKDAVHKKYEATTAYPYMRRFLEAWEARAVALDTFPA